MVAAIMFVAFLAVLRGAEARAFVCRGTCELQEADVRWRCGLVCVRVEVMGSGVPRQHVPARYRDAHSGGVPGSPLRRLSGDSLQRGWEGTELFKNFSLTATSIS